MRIDGWGLRDKGQISEVTEERGTIMQGKMSEVGRQTTRTLRSGGLEVLVWGRSPERWPVEMGTLLSTTKYGFQETVHCIIMRSN